MAIGFPIDPNDPPQPGDPFPQPTGSDPIVSEIESLLDAITRRLSAFFSILLGIFDFLKSFFEALGLWFYHIFVDYILPVLRAMAAVYRRLHTLLQRYLGPIIKILNRIRDWYIRHILPWQKLVIEIIQRVRVALALLRLLGVKWAAKLDADLAKIQGYVTLSIQDVLKYLNTVSSYLSLIVDPGMIIRRDFFAASLFGSLGALKRAVAFGSNLPLTASQQDAEQGDKGLLNPKTPFATRAADGTITFSPAFQSIQANTAAALPDYSPLR